MLKKSLLAFISVCLYVASWAGVRADSAFSETSLILHTSTGDIHGTLTLPEGASAREAVVLIIAGSGPTDRNGNNPMMKNGSLQMLAYGLANSHIASLRYDKRGIGESAPAGKKESDLRFEDYVNDARQWIKLLKGDKRFSRVIVVGHSEGSLIGMIASGGGADGYVSIAGAGESADKILKRQLSQQPQQIRDLCYSVIDSLVSGRTVKEVNPMLFTLFRPSVQPYMISWFRYDPQAEIKKLSIPVLLLQGTNDLQVTEEDARLLAKANPHAELHLIKGMNHIFKIVGDDRNANVASYNNNTLPISTELVGDIVRFTTSFR